MMLGMGLEVMQLKSLSCGIRVSQRVSELNVLSPICAELFFRVRFVQSTPLFKDPTSQILQITIILIVDLCNFVVFFQKLSANRQTVQVITEQVQSQGPFQIQNPIQSGSQSFTNIFICFILHFSLSKVLIRTLIKCRCWWIERISFVGVSC
jgi:hypothetical protein